MRYGQFMVYGGYAPQESWTIIDTKDYQLRVKKTWVEATKVWHLQFFSIADSEHRWECFLTHEQIKNLKDIL